MSVSIIIVEKNGVIREQQLKLCQTDELYKKAGFKSAEGFISHAEWNIDDLHGKTYAISVYGKTKGKANQENKYEFPPPIDNTLFFGNCIVVNRENGAITSLTAKEWETIYNFLYGGFEDLEEDTDDSEETEDENVVLDKYGYEKNDFIADDDEELEMDGDGDDEDSEEEPRKKKRAASKKSAAKPVNKKITKPEPEINDNTLFECGSELSEESYV
jgi:hypothetical protein